MFNLGASIKLGTKLWLFTFEAYDIKILSFHESIEVWSFWEAGFGCWKLLAVIKVELLFKGLLDSPGAQFTNCR